MSDQPTAPSVRQVDGEYVRRELDRIRLHIQMRDYEKAHLTEDQLFIDVLRAIATEHCDDPKACAAEAIKADSLAYPRWMP